MIVNKVKDIVLKFWAENKSQLWEAAKAAARYLVFLTVGWFASYFEILNSTDPTYVTFVVFSFLTFLDKWLHENWRASAKAATDRTGVKGITPF